MGEIFVTLTSKSEHQIPKVFALKSYSDLNATFASCSFVFCLMLVFPYGLANMCIGGFFFFFTIIFEIFALITISWSECVCTFYTL